MPTFKELKLGPLHLCHCLLSSPGFRTLFDLIILSSHLGYYSYFMSKPWECELCPKFVSKPGGMSFGSRLPRLEFQNKSICIFCGIHCNGSLYLSLLGSQTHLREANWQLPSLIKVSRRQNMKALFHFFLGFFYLV